MSSSSSSSSSSSVASSSSSSRSISVQPVAANSSTVSGRDPVCGKKIASRFLGNSGILVSEFCLGAMTLQLTGKGGPFGMPGTVNEKVSYDILDRYVELGGNFIDTADVYNESEECIGNWLSSKSNRSDFRDQLVITSKVRHRTGPGENDLGLSRKHIMANLDRSLKRLQTPFIDLYQAHVWDNRTDIYDVMRTLNDLVRIGKVRSIGFSNFPAWQAQKALEYAKYMGLESFVSNQSQYSLMCRSSEWDLIPQCLDANLSFLTYSPLAGGWLSGKYRRDINAPPAGSRLEWGEGFGGNSTFRFKSNHENEQTYAIVEELVNIGEELKATPAQVALRWVAQRPGVTSVIVGARTVEQLNDNLGAAFIQLNNDQMERLKKVSDIPVPYPWGVVASRAR